MLLSPPPCQLSWRATEIVRIECKLVLRPVPLRAPWQLTPSWRQNLKKILHFTPNHLRPTLFSPSTHRSWIASATIRRWLPAGQTLKPRTAYAQHYAPTWGSRLGWRYVPGQPYQYCHGPLGDLPAGVAHEAVGLYVYYIQFFLLTSIILSCYVSRAMHVNLASFFFLVVATGALPWEKYVSRMPFCKPCGCIFWFPLCDTFI